MFFKWNRSWLHFVGCGAALTLLLFLQAGMGFADEIEDLKYWVQKAEENVKSNYHGTLADDLKEKVDSLIKNASPETQAHPEFASTVARYRELTLGQLKGKIQQLAKRYDFQMGNWKRVNMGDFGSIVQDIDALLKEGASNDTIIPLSSGETITLGEMRTKAVTLSQASKKNEAANLKRNAQIDKARNDQIKKLKAGNTDMAKIIREQGEPEFVGLDSKKHFTMAYPSVYEGRQGLWLYYVRRDNGKLERKQFKPNP